MKRYSFNYRLIGISIFWVFFFIYIQDISGQELLLEQIRMNLLNHPPSFLDSSIRKDNIIDLDAVLKHDSSRISPAVILFYQKMMEKVKDELAVPIDSGMNIWMMYNHGYVVKTPEVVFAFDLTDGYSGWSTTYLHNDLINMIDVLFISHSHGDHYNQRIKNMVLANGGSVVVPAEDSWMGNISVAAGDHFNLSNLKVKVHDGLHSVPVRIFEVTVPSGIKIVHTGDNQTSQTLPFIDSTHVLLLNAWVNESGSATAVVGMQNCINKIIPLVMIPGHIQELSHNYMPGNPASRVPYAWAYQVETDPLHPKVLVMTWGEKYHIHAAAISNTNEYQMNTPGGIVINGVFPNPASNFVIIPYSTNQGGLIKLSLYNSSGSLINEQFEGHKPPGDHLIRLNILNCPAGNYYLGLELNRSKMAVKKIILIR